MIGVPHNKCFKSIREFQLIKESTLGSGSFGVVQLARHRTTCRMYAIKVVFIYITRSALFPLKPKPGSSKDRYSCTAKSITHISLSSGIRC